jgi:N-acetylglucosaminyldiphosphoundecaprenol N-acetyl-beta-D-mannosaminyltransferase
VLHQLEDMNTQRQRVPVIGVQVDVLTWEGALSRIASWGRAHESRYVCFSNVHSAVTAAFDPGFHQVIADSDMCTPDGAPVTWMLRQLGAHGQRRLNGPDLMWRYFAAQAPLAGKVYFYGGSPEALRLLRARVEAEFPGLEVVGTWSPPFRPATRAEDADDVARINASGAHVVFVGLGCPKQEGWMADHRGQVHAVMIGVGAAFDYHAGLQPRAPQWMQHHGLEWAHRLVCEPRRLWRRYLFTNIPFLFMGGAQWLSSRINGARPGTAPPVAAVTHVDLPYEAKPAPAPAAARAHAAAESAPRAI